VAICPVPDSHWIIDVASSSMIVPSARNAPTRGSPPPVEKVTSLTRRSVRPLSDSLDQPQQVQRAEGLGEEQVGARRLGLSLNPLAV
jgi:hypothetical protein